jgi:GH35 family endo-1,4-beta-xylanase
MNISTVITLVTKALRNKGADVDGLGLDIKQLLGGTSARDLLSNDTLSNIDKSDPASLIFGLLQQRGVDVNAFDFQSLLNLNTTNTTGRFSIDSLLEGDIAKQVRDLNISDLSKVIKIVKEGEKEVKKIAQELTDATKDVVDTKK